MTTTAAAENLAGRPAAEKKDEKVEKRKALGRGLASLLPGPRVVVPGVTSATVAREQAPQAPNPESSGLRSARPQPYLSL